MNNNDLLIYAAGPIDLGTTMPGWRNTLMNLLSQRDIDATMFDPSTAYKLSFIGRELGKRGRFIEDVNNTALLNSNLFIAVVPNGITSIGTPIEANLANRMAINSFLITDIPRGKSVYLDNMFKPDKWVYVKDLNNHQAVDFGLNFLADIIATTIVYPNEVDGHV